MKAVITQKKSLWDSFATKKMLSLIGEGGPQGQKVWVPLRLDLHRVAKFCLILGLLICETEIAPSISKGCSQSEMSRSVLDSPAGHPYLRNSWEIYGNSTLFLPQCFLIFLGHVSKKNMYCRCAMLILIFLHLKENHMQSRS